MRRVHQRKHASVLLQRTSRNWRNTGDEHLQRVTRYLKRTKNKHLQFHGPATVPTPWEQIRAQAWVDSDHAGCPDTSKSYTGYCIHIGSCKSEMNGAIDWTCRRQGIASNKHNCTANIANTQCANCGERHHVSICPQRQAVKPFREARNIAEELPSTDVQSDIARHSTDAEVLATSDVATPAYTVRTLLKELGATQTDPTVVFSDSKPAVDYLYKDTTPRLRHWNVLLRATRQLIRRQALEFTHVPGCGNRADALTKRLSLKSFSKHANALLGHQDSTAQ